MFDRSAARLEQAPALPSPTRQPRPSNRIVTPSPALRPGSRAACFPSAPQPTSPTSRRPQQGPVSVPDPPRPRKSTARASSTKHQAPRPRGSSTHEGARAPPPTRLSAAHAHASLARVGLCPTQSPKPVASHSDLSHPQAPSATPALLQDPGLQPAQRCSGALPCRPYRCPAPKLPSEPQPWPPSCASLARQIATFWSAIRAYQRHWCVCLPL